MTDPKLHERVAALEVETTHASEQLRAHGEHLKALDRAIVSLVSEVKQIRNALYAVAFALTCQVPWLKTIIDQLFAIMR